MPKDPKSFSPGPLAHWTPNLHIPLVGSCHDTHSSAIESSTASTYLPMAGMIVIADPASYQISLHLMRMLVQGKQ